MRLRLLLAIAACVAGLALAYARRHAGHFAPRPPVTGAAAVVERFECYRCHDAPGKLVPAERKRHCVRCHQEILAGALDDAYPADRVARWKNHIAQLTAVPSLAGIERLRRDWLVAFLQQPCDLRPELVATMPRMPIGPADAASIADHFLPPREPPAPVASGDAARGRAIYVAQQCGACHHFGGAQVPGIARTPRPEVHLAPDLRHARDRMHPGTIVAWLLDPAALKRDALMPRLGLSEEEARDLAAFLVEEPLAPPPAPAAPARLPLLERRVTYDEVETRVLKRVCWHCHSDPEPVGGDGGPGNTGGFGFAGRGLDLGSYEGVRRGARGRDVLAPAGEPLLVAVMRARHVEAAGGTVPGVRGMPLGLAPIPLEDIRLVETWIAQGAPGPE